MMAVVSEEILQVQREADCLYTAEQVAAALTAMAAAVNRQLAGTNPLCLALMTGGIVTAGQLLTRLDLPLQLDYIHATRYQEQTQGGALQWRALPNIGVAGRSVLLIDDILDEGHTLEAVHSWCREQGAESVWSAVLIDKPSNRRKAGIRADIVGLQVPDRYVFGCGMDYKGYCRNLPGIYAVKGG